MGKIFQEISDEFTEMAPTSLDELEAKVLTVIYNLGSYLMESKVEDWNTELRYETCPDCGTKLKLEHLQKLAGYIECNRHGIWYDEARKNGISIGAGSVDKAGDILICRRMKLRGMRWSRKGADAVLAIRILVSNGEWHSFWERYKAA